MTVQFEAAMQACPLVQPSQRPSFIAVAPFHEFSRCEAVCTTTLHVIAYATRSTLKGPLTDSYAVKAISKIASGGSGTENLVCFWGLSGTSGANRWQLAAASPW